MRSRFFQKHSISLKKHSKVSISCSLNESAAKVIYGVAPAMGHNKFDEVLSQADPKDDLVQLIGSRLGNKYPLDSAYKKLLLWFVLLPMAHLAKACTHGYPRLIPSMRYVVAALMTVSSSSMEEWEVGFFYEY